MSKYILKDIPGRIPENISNKMPENISNKISENILNKLLENLPILNNKYYNGNNSKYNNY